MMPQRPPAGVRSVRRVLAVGAVLGVLLALGWPAGPAAAHAALVSTDPAQSSVLVEAPNQVELTFTEAVSPVRERIQVIAPDGSRADEGEPTAIGARLVIPLRPGGADGTYLVSFRVISADSHPVAGTFTYSVGAPSPGGAPVLADGGETTGGAVSRIYPAVRWVGYAGLVLMVGATLVLALLWPRRLDRRDAIRVVWIGAGLVAAATVLEVALQVPYVNGGGLTDLSGDGLRVVLGSQFGAAHLVRLGVLLATLVLLRPLLRGEAGGYDRVLLSVLGTIGIATWSVSGHPSASPVPLVTVVADMVHLSAMSVWLGGLVMLVAFLLPRANLAELGAVMPVWSRWATYAVAVLVLTGTAQALVEIGTLPAVTGTRYGWLVMIKVGLVAAALSVAWFSRRLVAPIAASGDPYAIPWTDDADSERGPEPGPDAEFDEAEVEDPEVDDADRRGLTRALRRFVTIEVAVALVVLGVASVLVQTTPGRSAEAESAVPTIQSAELKSQLYTLIVDVQPGQVGVNYVHLYANTPDGQPADVKEWRGYATLVGQDLERIDIDLLAIQPDHATGQVGLIAAGTWTLTFTLRTSEIDQDSVEMTVQIRE
jgi:copper transport protein